MTKDPTLEKRYLCDWVEPSKAPAPGEMVYPPPGTATHVFMMGRRAGKLQATMAEVKRLVEATEASAPYVPGATHWQDGALAPEQMRVPTRAELDDAIRDCLDMFLPGAGAAFLCSLRWSYAPHRGEYGEAEVLVSSVPKRLRVDVSELRVPRFEQVVKRRYDITFDAMLLTPIKPAAQEHLAPFAGVHASARLQAEIENVPDGWSREQWMVFVVGLTERDHPDHDCELNTSLEEVLEDIAAARAEGDVPEEYDLDLAERPAAPRWWMGETAPRPERMGLKRGRR